MLDYEELARIASEHPLTAADQRFGEKGVTQATAIMDLVRSVYEARGYEFFQEGLIVFVVLENQGQDVPSGGQLLTDLQQLAAEQVTGLTIRLYDDGRREMWPEIRTEVPQSGTLIYRFVDNVETFLVDGDARKIPNFGLPSVLVAPTFVGLEASLSHYATNLARLSQCLVLNDAWRDERRLLLLNKQETTMRRSLALYLRSSLRDHKYIEVREEQNVDESHPVDIKVTWTFSNRLALIEIKWLGKSAEANGDHITTEYTEARAHEGAQQLADYLDENRPHTIVYNTMGYLVIYDARRRGTTITSVTISGADGMHYANREITFAAEILGRADFANPRRMFIEPICT